MSKTPEKLYAELLLLQLVGNSNYNELVDEFINNTIPTITKCAIHVAISDCTTCSGVNSCMINSIGNIPNRVDPESAIKISKLVALGKLLILKPTAIN